MNVSRVLEGVGIALDSLRGNKVRAFLTILGIAIGVMVVIAIGSAITGFRASVQEQVNSLGPKTYFVQRWFQGGLQISDGSEESQPWRKNPPLTIEEAKLLRNLPGVDRVVYRSQSNAPMSAGVVKLSSVQLVGFTPGWILSVGGTLTLGRNYTEVEEAASSHVVVVNDKLAETLFPGVDPVGRRMKIAGQTFDIVGVYVQASSLFNGDPSPMAVIPHSTFQKVGDYDPRWLMFAVTPKDSVSLTDSQDEVTVALRSRRGLRPGQENNFALVSQDKLLDMVDKITGGFFIAMIALSSVGLMVGGVGVVAIMMISVTERTREIGVRKALGATRREILWQFLVEAATLTLVGGIAGMILGALIAWGIRSLSPVPATVPLWSVVAALAASVVTGVGFGLYPASKASRLDPVEALRYE
jgi:putative ABC transport system permease protein